MGNFELVKRKLEAFIRKYYLNQIIKGSLLFLTVGLLYFLLVVGLEHFLWLSTFGRSLLFWVFILVEFILLFNYIGIPLLKLFRISGGITEFQASEIIGRHFPEVNDKLKNLLQLKHDNKQSDLLLASIEQRSKNLSGIPFTRAIDYKTNTRYLKFAVFPVLIILGIILAGKAEMITGSFSRITDYNTVYLKPAPFRFIIENDSLSAREGESFKLKLKTEGEYNPEMVQIVTGNGQTFMKQVSPGAFEHTFIGLDRDMEFSFRSNQVASQSYNLEVIKVPKLLNFEMQLDYPSYTGLKDEMVNGTGNITVPEGTKVRWQFNTRNTESINFGITDSVIQVAVEENIGILEKSLNSNLAYSVTTSNELVKDYEKLDYSVNVIRDAYPEINVTQRQDSLDTDVRYFKGDVSDDYGLSRLQLVYYSEEDKEILKRLALPVSRESFDEFHFIFPGQLELENGNTYSYYFQVFDNDEVNGAKSSKSETFSYRKKTMEELEEEKLQEQNRTIEEIGKQLDEYEKSDKELEDFSRLKKEKEELNYNERKRLEEFLKRQKQQNEMMRNYSKKLEENIEEKKQGEEMSPMEEELSKRLENNEKRLEENEELLKELEEYSEKIKEEELGKKLEELSKQNRNNQRNLEQLLELTKRYYVEEKKQKLARDLEKLAEEQEQLSEQNEENNSENQQDLNKKFEDFQEQMDQLEKENEKLQQPKDLGREEVDEESIKKDQQDAQENLEQNNQEGAKQKQKDAAKKMKQMSQQMQQSSMQGQQQQLEADAETLRQILDNLIVFSFEQEALMDKFKRSQQSNPRYAGMLKEQSNLRENFRHVDDSLYSLALRNPMINEVITDKLTDVEFDIEKALERLSENQIPQGTASQQYVVTGANDLANLLDQTLSSMQQMMMNPQSGSGGEEMQLPDIIQKQKELQGEMQKGMKEKQEGQEKGKSQGEGEGDSEELFEIYKQQQMLRMQMEKLMEENGMKESDSPAEDMKRLEEQLLDKGFDEENLKRMQNLEYELLEFEKALKLQGSSEKRKSETNRKEYENSIQDQIDKAKEYFNSTEILNRQILPLRQIYREKVKEYFGKGRD